MSNERNEMNEGEPKKKQKIVSFCAVDERVYMFRRNHRHRQTQQRLASIDDDGDNNDCVDVIQC